MFWGDKYFVQVFLFKNLAHPASFQTEWLNAFWVHSKSNCAGNLLLDFLRFSSIILWNSFEPRVPLLSHNLQLIESSCYLCAWQMQICSKSWACFRDLTGGSSTDLRDLLDIASLTASLMFMQHKLIASLGPLTIFWNNDPPISTTWSYLLSSFLFF